MTRVHQRREVDFRRGRRLGQGEHLVQWLRPERPDWMGQTTYERMPDTISIREVEVQVNQPGFRVESFVVVTTLADVNTYSRQDIADLYGRRWSVELDTRAWGTRGAVRDPGLWCGTALRFGTNRPGRSREGGLVVGDQT